MSSSDSSDLSLGSAETSAEPPRSVTLNRRQALRLIGSACAVSSLSGCVIAEVFNSPELGETFSFDLSDPQFSPLQTVGEAVDIDNAAGRPVILIRVNETEIMAVNRICTHSQCDMKLGGLGQWDGEKIICLCHNSHFSPRGEVLRAPATEALPTYEVQFDATSTEAQIIFEAELSAGETAGETAGDDAGETAGDDAGDDAGDMAGQMGGADDVPEEYRELVNPFEGDAEVVSIGAELYQTNCVFCHGEDGVGNTLPGADAFNVDQSPWSDGHLFWVLTEGIEGTSMSAYDSVLNEEQRWQVITYLRSLRTDL